MLAFVPVIFEAYSALKDHLRWTQQHLVAFADKTGRCWPSVRKLAEISGRSKSTIGRHLTELAKEGAITRRRRPGGGYEYTVAARFLPAARLVSHQRDSAVPPMRTEEKTPKKTESARARFAVIDAGLPRQAEWEPRLRGWLKRRFWLPAWGPKPDEPGCWAPIEALNNVQQSG